MRKYIIYLKSMTFLLGLIVIIQVKAQSYVTYNHDEAKMNQITVQEIGAGCLTPDLYYWAFHNSYRNSCCIEKQINLSRIGRSFCLSTGRRCRLHRGGINETSRD